MKEIVSYLCKLPIIIKITQGAFYLAFMLLLLSFVNQSEYFFVIDFYRFLVVTTLSCVSALYYKRNGLLFTNLVIFIFVIIHLAAIVL